MSIHEESEAACLFCGEPEVAQLHEIWSPREFSIETCCLGMHEAVSAFLADEPKEAGRWLGERGLGMVAGQRYGLDDIHKPGMRRVIDHDGRLLLDWNLEIKPVHRDIARNFVRDHHDHCPPPAGWRFGAGLMNGSERIGVVMVGRPVARMLDQAAIVEVNRLCINRDLAPGLVWNGCSMLYGWAAKQARSRGFAKIITYTLESEDGTSLKAAGWVPEAKTKGGSRNRKSRPREDKTSTEPKIRWAPKWCATGHLALLCSA